MSDALKIMDEIERFPGNEGGVITLSRTDRQSLRTALEAQADWIAFQDQKHTECAENLVKAREELAQAEQENKNKADLAAEREQRLVEALRFVQEHDFGWAKRIDVAGMSKLRSVVADALATHNNEGES